jgi:hypothetical protein
LLQPYQRKGGGPGWSDPNYTADARARNGHDVAQFESKANGGTVLAGRFDSHAVVPTSIPKPKNSTQQTGNRRHHPTANSLPHSGL